jgi:hypothetical protein
MLNLCPFLSIYYVKITLTEVNTSTLGVRVKSYYVRPLETRGIMGTQVNIIDL